MPEKSVKHCSKDILFRNICTRRKQYEARWFPVVFGFRSEHTKLNTAASITKDNLCESESHSGKVAKGSQARYR